MAAGPPCSQIDEKITDPNLNSVQHTLRPDHVVVVVMGRAARDHAPGQERKTILCRAFGVPIIIFAEHLRNSCYYRRNSLI